VDVPFNYRKRRKYGMKKSNNPFQTNEGGIIQSPKKIVKNPPKATVVKGNDLRAGKGKK
jgi:ribosomal protein L13E